MLFLCWFNFVVVISPSEDQITQRTSISESLIVVTNKQLFQLRLQLIADW